jgi:cyclic beta-1,2-glucan synthetase
MLEERPGRFGCIPRLPNLVLSAGLILGLVIGCPFSLAGEQGAIRLSEAGEQGTFNVGNAHAAVAHVPGPAGDGEILKLEYTIAPGAAAGLYAKKLPGRFDSEHIDVVRVGVKTNSPEEARQVSAYLELKGTAGVQRVAMDIHPQWAFAEAMVNWSAIGVLNEVVVSMTGTGDAGQARGAILIDVRFEELSFFRKLSLSWWARTGGVLFTSMAISLLVGLMRWRPGRGQENQTGSEQGSLVQRLPLEQTRWPRSLLRDLVQGLGVVLIVLLALVINELGSMGPLEVGWTAIALACAGAAVAEFWKYGLTGRHLTGPEVFQDTLVTGLLATSSSSLAILQAPAAWSELFLLSQTVAAAAALFYHLAGAYRLATTGKHLNAASAVLIVGTPYVIGGLTLLESGNLLRSAGNFITAALVADRPEISELAGRVFVLFSFNEAVALGLGLATRGVLTRSFRAHTSMLAVAVAAVVAPWVAAMGSGATVAAAPAIPRFAAILLTTMISQAGLWAEAYLVTGLIMDAIHGQAPSGGSASGHPVTGMKKAMVYSGVFMGGLHTLGALREMPLVQWASENQPILTATLLGALTFPLIKTVIETFDGSPPFFRRLRRNYQTPVLPFRGAVVGMGLGYGLVLMLPGKELATRAWFGFGFGAVAYAGIDILRDFVNGVRGRGRVQSPRYYLAHALLGGLIGGAVGFYLDSSQVAVVTAKFQRYLTAGQPPELHDVYPLVSKWGHLNLGMVSGGVSLLFVEALQGVINWSTAAWLFAINRTFMRAYFWKDTTPIRTLFTSEGLVQVGENLIQVLRWGLWMSPIISSFLRPMGEPTWYNQDGAVRTVLAIVRDATLTPEAFRAWSLQVFISVLAYDAVRVLIWLDHMGLRVATLVNLSFLGMDSLERRLARFLAPAATARCIPEGVKRFTTWGPLLIPFYIPRGKDWDHAWSAAEAIRSHESGGLIATLSSLSLAQRSLLVISAAALCTTFFSAIRLLKARWGRPGRSTLSLENLGYEVRLRDDGEIVSRARGQDYDLTRRSYDLLDPAGRALFLVDASSRDGGAFHSWPVIGNVPRTQPGSTRLEGYDHGLRVRNITSNLQTTVEISLPTANAPLELWTVTVENLADTARSIKVVPYLEWVLDHPETDRGHTQYGRLFTQTEYVSRLHSLISWDRHSKALGFLASDRPPEGFLTSRIDFLGRARSLWTPRVTDTLAFLEPRDTSAHATLDPIGSLRIGMAIPPRGSSRVRLLMGFARDRQEAIDLVTHLLQPQAAGPVTSTPPPDVFHPIKHGDIPPGVSPNYAEFSDEGRTLVVHTPFTPRPFDHTMANALGQVTSVTNRGLHTSSSVNSQQNRLTPDWADTVTRELPGEAIYLYDPDVREWYSPTYHPANNADSTYVARFSVDGTATFLMTRGAIETQLTVFVPPDDPATVYLLTVRNHADVPRPLRLAPYFQIVLAGQPEHSGPLQVELDPARRAIFYQNPRNTYRSGPAFAAISHPASHLETNRGRFFGAGRDTAHPYLVEHGEPDTGMIEDNRPIAALLTTLQIAAHAETSVAMILGQADDRRKALSVIRKYQQLDTVNTELDATRRWWLSLMDTLQVRTNQPEFDRYLDWLKYQALAERIWARRGFYQASGAYGFRDQLQDSVNLMWMDPSLARKQILLHASQQFLEGDVVHWFHRLQDGRTGFVGRTHASDNLLWLPWSVVEYIGQTGDESLLDERTAYLEAEDPFEPLPAGKHGIGFDPLRSSREESIYRHCLKAIDLVLGKRMGEHGLPLMGTGDWNDGLDEIGSRGRGESVWLGFFLAYILEHMAGIVASKEGPARQSYYLMRLEALKDALEGTWRGDRYLRAIHDDGTEIGVEGSGVWEIDALTAAWAVMSGINPERGQIVFETALRILEKQNTILLGWPPLREDTTPYLGRSSVYPQGVRENGMYCHGVQWLVGAARILAERSKQEGNVEAARRYLETTYRLWLKISPISHAALGEIENYGGQPNKQAADMVTTFDPGRMIWNGYTGAAGWMFRQALEGVLGLRLAGGKIVARSCRATAGEPRLIRISRDTSNSPLPRTEGLRAVAEEIVVGEAIRPSVAVLDSDNSREAVSE